MKKEWVWAREADCDSELPPSDIVAKFAADWKEDFGEDIAPQLQKLMIPGSKPLWYARAES